MNVAPFTQRRRIISQKIGDLNLAVHFAAHFNTDETRMKYYTSLNIPLFNSYEGPHHVKTMY
jgi:hypothetical protein